MSEFFELFSNSIYIGLLLSIAIGIIGSLMLINKYSYIAAAIAHGSYGGIGLSLFFSIPILLGTGLFATFLSLILAYITYKNPHRSDLLIGTIWAFGMSVGIVLVDLTPGYNVDLMAYLFGNILLISKEDIFFLLAIDIVLVLVLAIYINKFLAVAFDRDFAKIRGINVAFIHMLIILLMTFSIVGAIRAVGLILVIALFSIPPFIAEKFTKNFITMVMVSSLLAMIFITLGLVLSYNFNISATPSIVIIAALFFILSFFKE
jgi:zinc transport system permease protein